MCVTPSFFHYHLFNHNLACVIFQQSSSLSCPPFLIPWNFKQFRLSKHSLSKLFASVLGTHNAKIKLELGILEFARSHLGGPIVDTRPPHTSHALSCVVPGEKHAPLFAPTMLNFNRLTNSLWVGHLSPLSKFGEGWNLRYFSVQVSLREPIKESRAWTSPNLSNSLGTLPPIIIEAVSRVETKAKLGWMIVLVRHNSVAFYNITPLLSCGHIESTQLCRSRDVIWGNHGRSPNGPK